MNDCANWDYETELLLVGSGAGGTTSAIVAKDLGADVLLIEKSSLYGGTTAVSGGNIWIPCSPQMDALAYPDTREEALVYLQQTIGELADVEKLQTYIDTGPALVEYLQQHTPVRFVAGPLPDYYSDMPGGKDKYRALDPSPINSRALGGDVNILQPPLAQTTVAGIAFTTGEIARILRKEPGWLKTVASLLLRQLMDRPWRVSPKLPRRLTLGNALSARLLLGLRERNIPLWLNTSLSTLIVDKDRVLGAVVKQGEKTLRIHATKGVIIAAGGFNNNSTMREKYLPQSPKAEWSVALADNTGDGINAGVEIGADTALMHEAWWIPVYRLPMSGVTGGMVMERSFPGCIIVDQNGERYLNEAANYDEVGRCMVQASRLGRPVSPSYFIFDGRFRANYLAGPLRPMPAFFDRFLDKDTKQLLTKADSLMALANKLNIDPERLCQTVREHNHFAQTGVDTQFSRGEETYERHYSDPSVGPNSTLAPIQKSPFYAMPIYPGDISTKGGLVTDRDARVLTTNGDAIAGLYAIGNSAASMTGSAYPGGGITLGPAMVFGTRAAMHATGKAVE